MFIVEKKVRKPRKIYATEYPYRDVKKILCTFDTETDPFAEGRIVKPFAAGFHIIDSGEYYDFWGDDCIDQFFTFLKENYEGQKLQIYAHNGGNFDFYFCLDHFDDGMRPFIINGRLAQVFMGGQEFRDSYAAIPVALDKYSKTVIDYNKFERPVRENNKAEILSYMRDDCIKLGELVKAWTYDFGNKMTMAGVALPMLRSYHGFEEMSEDEDNEIRPYYFGGRVQCFESGILKDDWKVYDVNSMYPFVMRDYLHPVSHVPILQNTITPKTHFAHIRAWSDGALPIRGEGYSLDFPKGLHDFYACIHEINAAQELGLLKIKHVYKAWRFDAMSNFSSFIDEFYAMRMKAREDGDRIRDIFYKLIMNSAYGKLAQDPRRYKDYIFNPQELPSPQFCIGCFKNGYTAGTCARCDSGTTDRDGWRIDSIRDGKTIYCRPRATRSSRQGTGFFNVAGAASVTSAARAELLKGIAKADRPIYCDTDSLICRNLDCNVSPDLLGAWKIEASGDTAAIAGKKLYAVFNDGEEIKKASKGVKLSALDIARVARGEVVEYSDPVPKFSLDGGAVVDRKRTIRRTV